jgi:Fur family zinc uptake transcriptional regulator
MFGDGIFPRPDHDHEHCRRAVLDAAERVSSERGARLTTQRRRVLDVIASSHGAIGAYEILDLFDPGGRRPAPVAVYRALDFLIGLGMVHRLASLNAYVVCAAPLREHNAQFLICSACRRIGEIVSPAVDGAIAVAATDADFAIASILVEVTGTCAACREASGDRAHA